MAVPVVGDGTGPLGACVPLERQGDADVGMTEHAAHFTANYIDRLVSELEVGYVLAPSALKLPYR